MKTSGVFVKSFFKNSDWNFGGKAADFIHCTLLVLIDFCPVQSELTWRSRTKTVDILSEMIMDYLGLTLHHFEFLTLYLDVFAQN